MATGYGDFNTRSIYRVVTQSVTRLVELLSRAKARELNSFGQVGHICTKASNQHTMAWSWAIPGSETRKFTSWFLWVKTSSFSSHLENIAKQNWHGGMLQVQSIRFVRPSFIDQVFWYWVQWQNLGDILIVGLRKLTVYYILSVLTFKQMGVPPISSWYQVSLRLVLYILQFGS